MLVLMYPMFVLLARRIRDMGFSTWLLLAPMALTATAFASKLHYISLGEPLDRALPWAALAVCAAFVLWGCFTVERVRGARH